MITVLSSGARTLVQDAGRPGYEHLGVPTSGAADLPSLRLANILVGNDPGEPAFEVAVFGPSLHFTADAVVAFTGADADLLLDDKPVPTRHTLRVHAGQVLTVGALRGGVYGYLAVAGGLDVPLVLGSAASCTMSGLGGPALTAGQSLALREPHAHAVDGFAPSRPEGVFLNTRLRVLPGPHAHLFPAAALDRFYGTTWQVSAMSSRVGVRLDGPAPLDLDDTSLPSMGMVTGAIQVPPSGQPIVLGPDHGTVGGYPVLGVVHPADMPALMQRVSGARVAFLPAAHGTLANSAGADQPVLRARTLTVTAR